MSKVLTSTLGQCCEIVSGATPQTSIAEYWDGEIFWATPKDLSSLNGHYISSTPRKITASGLQNCAANVLPPNSVLFSSRAPIGHVAINTVPMATNQGFKSFIPRPDKLDAKFLLHWLRKNRNHLESLGNGATFKEVSKAIVSRVEIVLPPVEEQRRIAAILDQADALRAQRREALAQLDSLAQAIFVEMFGDPITNERGWPEAFVSDFVAGFETGKSLVADDEEDTNSNFRVLKISAVTSFEFKPEQCKALPSDYVPPLSHFVQNGDLLFSQANTSDLIGATAFVTNASSNLVLPDKLWRFVWPKVKSSTPLFVHCLFRQKKFRFEIARRASGTSGSMKNISQHKVLSIRVGLPPLEIQESFALRHQAIDALKCLHRTALTESTTLFTSLQHRAFNGEL